VTKVDEEKGVTVVVSKNDSPKEEDVSYQHGGGNNRKKKDKGGSDTNHDSSDDVDDECHFTECCANIFIMISTVAVLVHASLLVGQILPIFAVSDVDNLQIALRVYMSVFLVAFICIETEVILRTSSTLGNNFMLRGVMYSFVGLIGVEQSAAIRVDMSHGNHIASVWAQISSLVLHISAWFETAMGCLYFVLGALCMREMRDKMRQKERERQERAQIRSEALGGDLEH
jgi:hypothetical protein